MRIETYNQVQQLYRANKTVKTGKTEKGSFSDQLHISDMGKDIQSVKQAMANVPDIREEITEPLKQAVQSGAYQVSEDSFAARLFQKYNEMR